MKIKISKVIYIRSQSKVLTWYSGTGTQMLCGYKSLQAIVSENLFLNCYTLTYLFVISHSKSN